MARRRCSRSPRTPARSRPALDAARPSQSGSSNKPVVKSPESIRAICLDANASDGCVGVIAWMHTFSPARMWIGGLLALDKPLLHLHTQFNRDLPWATIDMDFMNLNQSAHGDREFAHLLTRLGRTRKTVVGHWQDPVGCAAHRRVGARCGGVAGCAGTSALLASATTCARSR